RKCGHVADHATDGRDGLLCGLSGRYEIIIVDRMLPTLDGLRIVKTLRSAGIDTPVLFLTALAEIEERVEGLEGGTGLSDEAICLLRTNGSDQCPGASSSRNHSRDNPKGCGPRDGSARAPGKARRGGHRFTTT